MDLARRSLELWHALERESGERLFRKTGGVDGGPEGSPHFDGALRSCELHDLPHEVLDGRELRRRVPAMAFPRGDRFVVQPDAGVLHPERCIEVHARMAEVWGAEVRTGSRVRAWTESPQGVRIELDDGEIVEAAQLVLAAGAWLPDLLAADPPPLEVERQVVAWFDPAAGPAFGPDAFPIFNVEAGGGHHYGVPSLHGRGPRIGRFGHLHEVVHPDHVHREATAADRTLLQSFADLYLRGAGSITRCVSCLFTNTPDRHFIVDRLGGSPVVVAGGFSGHGFKFASAVGEGVARLVTGGEPGASFDLFRVDRFAPPASDSGPAPT